MARETKKPKFDGPRDTAIREWLQRGLQKQGLTRKGLAQAIGISEAGVSRLLSGNRRLQMEELPNAARYVGEEPPTTNHSATVVSLHTNRAPVQNNHQSGSVAVPLVRVVAVIAPGVWREPGAPVAIAERVPASPDPRVSNLKQYACKIETDSRYVICVPFADMRPKPIAGDVVHVRRTQAGRTEDTLRIVRIANDRVSLELINGNKAQGRSTAIAYPAGKDSDPLEIVGLVVGYFSPVSF